MLQLEFRKTLATWSGVDMEIVIKMMIRIALRRGIIICILFPTLCFLLIYISFRYMAARHGKVD